MNKQKALSNILILLGVAVALLSALLAIMVRDDDPRMVQYPDGALEKAEALMDAVCSGDYTNASALLYGQPNMGIVPDDGNLAIELIWTSYLDSMDYELAGACYVTQSGVAIDVVVRTMDVQSVIADMEGYAQGLLNRRVAAAGNMSDVYDDDNNFRQEILDAVMRDAAVQSLANNQLKKEQRLTLNLIFEGGEWWVIPDITLQSVLSGSF